ncbi:MAG: Holliday junction resolvase RuvX [Methanoregulaceae archaeon]|jgi:putative Holliday junction resolvase|nr:Holliday junction resolvase RuvX [Methanoregulaceae archaeon]
MRVLAVDFGGKRIGVAVGETAFDIITPRPALTATGTLKGDAALISQTARNEAAERIILGIPVNEEDSRMERICRKLGELIAEQGWAVDLVDEAFTSEEADVELRTYGLKASERRKQRDGEAARLIYQRWMFEQTNA